MSERFENTLEEVLKTAMELTNGYPCQQEYEARLLDPEGTRRAERIVGEAAERVLKDWTKIALERVQRGQSGPGSGETGTAAGGSLG